MANLYFLRYENMDKKTKNLGHKLVVSWVWAILWLACAFSIFPIWSTSAGLLDFLEKGWDPKKGDFEWEDVTICDREWKECFTFMDRNLWAETNDIKDEKSYWYKFQWWNNYGFTADGLKTTNKQWNTAEYWPKNPYSNSEFVVWNWNWSADWNSNLRWWEWDSEKNKRWLGVNYESRQWPCPDWYHVPSAWEITRALDIWTKSLNIKSSKNIQWLSSIAWKRYVYELWNHFNIPFAGRLNINGELVWVWKFGYLWLSSPSDEYASLLYINTNGVVKVLDYFRGDGYPVRCFKNTIDTPASPDDREWEDITICDKDDNTDCITMMDRNLWASEVLEMQTCAEPVKYHCDAIQDKYDSYDDCVKDGYSQEECLWWEYYWEFKSQKDCDSANDKLYDEYKKCLEENKDNSWSYGYHYQWWNNYWFASCLEEWCSTFPWWEKTSKTQIWDIEIPYSSSTFIIWYDDRLLKQNNNLWWWASDSEDNGRFASQKEAGKKWKSTEYNRQWPCPDWYHVPSAWEWWKAVELYAKNNSVGVYYNQWLVGMAWRLADGTNVWDWFREYFKIPFAGLRSVDANTKEVWKSSYLWSSSPFDKVAKNVYIEPNQVSTDKERWRGEALSIRCFKDSNYDWSDVDWDWVLDKKDKCPDTPKWAKVNEDWCPTDWDGDWVYDWLDWCPNTPKGYIVDAKGCSSIDSDKDGIIDDLDYCQDTPSWTNVNWEWCPDADSDWIQDGKDKCPSTPKWAKVDGDWCPVDSDGDWIYDGFDQCEGTPRGVDVDDIWCSDVDWDWIFDNKDQCPDTPKWYDVNDEWCPDLDWDWIFDNKDKCPDTPKWYDINDVWCPDLDWDWIFDNDDWCPKTPDWYKVDKTGCSNVDTDGDWVIDDLDNCPDTPKDTAVDTEGCPKK